MNPEWYDTRQIKIGDMPGDKVLITEQHIAIARTLHPILSQELERYPKIQDRTEGINGANKIVISVYGGSGVGKSETGALLAHFLRLEGRPGYVLSGDNYPHRRPAVNDEERLRRYRDHGLTALSLRDDFSNDWMRELAQMKPEMLDLAGATETDWLKTYREAGKAALAGYLGSEKEINFSYLNRVIANFKAGKPGLVLKRMGRSPEDVTYEKIDATQIQVLVIEWTHGNNVRLEGVDYPIYLYSSPAETLEHRRKRGRDTNIDSPLIELALELEQQQLLSQKNRAKWIVSKDNVMLQAADICEPDMGASHD
ncbi:hypothetical protein P0082_07330 [Candidatus Haliotispira prima]|uniref:Adenylylsulfate kinase n=1 Tax=Candidatus Haliotispira prima TaxID=3034016 RepID=A0ABY8ME82_9SPIO|nr:hypothetical protein P0082_07330 [Candidatus Haliotispira prima]